MVYSAVVDGDTDRWGEFTGNSSFLCLRFELVYLAIIPLRRLSIVEFRLRIVFGGCEISQYFVPLALGM